MTVQDQGKRRQRGKAGILIVEDDRVIKPYRLADIKAAIAAAMRERARV